MITPNYELSTRLSLVTNDYGYVAFSTNFDKPTGQEIYSNLNLIGKTALSKTIIGNNFSADYTLNGSTANCPTSTVASYSNTQTTIKVSDSVNTKFKVNDRVQIGIEQDNKIISIDSTNNTITLMNALTGVPTVGTIIKVKISQRIVVRGGDSTLLTGTIAGIEEFIFFKTSAMTAVKGRVTGQDL